MTTTTYREAITRAMADCLDEDDRAFVLGEDVGAAGGVFKVTEGLFERFGPQRVRDTPISEQAIIGVAIGAALRGLRPIAEIMFADFAAVCYDGIANQLPKYRYMTGGQVELPVTIRLVNGAGGGFGSQHSQPVENWFMNIVGLKVAVPSTPADAYGLFRAAMRDPNPVLFFEHKHLMGLKGELPDKPQQLELGKSWVARPGRDATVVATQLMLHRALEAAERLAGEGIEVEVVDPRTLVPLDTQTIGESVENTNHLVVAQESPSSGSWGANVISRIVSERFESLDAPPLLVCGPDTPIPYSAALEDIWLPTAERIADGVRQTLAY